MGSRVMHLCIASNVCTKLGLNQERFYSGCIAPDAHPHRKGSKAVTHFTVFTSEGPEIDCQEFLSKYQSRLNDSFYLGYYCHLLSDEIWFNRIYSRVIGSYNQHEQEARLAEYYKDFGRLNGKLIRKFRLKRPVLSQDFEMEEVENACFSQMCTDLKKDFGIVKRYLPVSLKILPVGDILDYIEEASRVSIIAIKELGRY